MKIKLSKKDIGDLKVITESLKSGYPVKDKYTIITLDSLLKKIQTAQAKKDMNDYYVEITTTAFKPPTVNDIGISIAMARAMVNESLVIQDDGTLKKLTEAIKSKPMTTDEMLIDIVSYNYRSHGFPCVFLDCSPIFNVWSITWRNPVDFNNEEHRDGQTPNEACKKAMEFILANPHIFTKKIKGRF